MRHLGDITKLKGNEVPIVDIVVGGSPCQDLSVAGKRAGLDGERSGLFMEQIRLIKEMREYDRANGRPTELVRPRFMVWENVAGAFSSNGGEDFRVVLEETAKVADENAVIPRLAKGQKWTPAGCIMGDGWSIAWRVHDAQFWGVPQRRKRISLVADFGGGSAPKILFERKGVHGDFEESGNPREETPRDAGEGAAQTGRALSFQERAGKPGGGKGILIQDEHTGALSTLNNQSVCVGIDAYNHTMSGDKAVTLTATSCGSAGHSGSSVMVYETQASGDRKDPSQSFMENKAYTLPSNPMSDSEQAVVYGISAFDSNSMKSGNPNSGIYKADTARTLDLNGGSPACNQGGMAVVCLEGTGSRPNSGEVRTPTVVMQKAPAEKKQTVYDWHRQDTRMTELKDVCVTAAAGWGGGGNNMPYVLEETKEPMSEVAAGLCAQDGRGGVHSQRLADPEGNFVIEAITSDGDKVSGTLDASYYKGCGERQGKERTVIIEPVTASKASHFTTGIEGGIADTLYATDYKEAQMIAYGIDRAAYNQGANALYDFSVEEEKIATQVAKGPGADCAAENCQKVESIVRRLTPMECERLQGYPDGWTDIGDWTDSKGKLHKGDSDSPRYKALGNSIALPFWDWMAERICKQYDRPTTMASLFDGIGGFPLVFSKHGCAPVWASEIEEFPIAVTKIRFPEEEEQK